MDTPQNLHTGIILDGNRRFAKKLMKQPWKGHEYGAKKIQNLFNWCKELGIEEITLYCLSLENFNRPKKEFDYLMDIFKKEFRDLKTNKEIEENKIKINFIGKRELLDTEIQELMREIEERTEKHENYTFNFALAYGGRQELLEAIQKLKENNEEINEENIKKHLWLKNDPDLIIRTGGEKRTSNFLPWQSTYSEWFFLEKMWPEFEKQDLINVIDEFHHRKRRFGK